MSSSEEGLERLFLEGLGVLARRLRLGPAYESIPESVIGKPSEERV